MSFYNPLMLYGLVATLIPLAIHLLSRRRTVSLPFSNVALLQTLQQDRMRRVKLRQILLLLIRSLLILLLVLAFSRPAVQGSGAGANVRTAAALLIDRSMSMRHADGRGGDLFRQATGVAARVLDSFSPQDEVVIYLVDDRIATLDASSLGQLKQRLGGLAPGYRSTDMAAAVEDALKRLTQASAPNRELYLFTDGARHGWKELPLGDGSREIERLSFFSSLHRPRRSNNVSIASVSASERLLAPGTPAAVQVVLKNQSPSAQNSLALVATSGGARVAQEQVALGAGEERRIFLNFTPERGGAIPFSVDIGADDLPADSRFRTFIHVPDSLKVLLVGSGADVYYLEQAFRSLSGPTSRNLIRTVSPEALPTTDLEGWSSVWLCNVPRLSDFTVSELQHKVEQGTGLVVALGSTIDARHYSDRILDRLIPARLIAVSGSPRLPGGDTSVFRSLRLPLPDHLLFSGLLTGEDAQSPHFYAHYRVRLSEGARPIVAFSDGFPAIAESRLGRGRVFLITTAFDLAWSELPVSGLMVPLVERMARYLAQTAAASGGSDYRVGQSIFREIDDAHPREAALAPPSGDTRTIWPEQQGGRAVWRVGEVEEPGYWGITAGGRAVDRFAVQVDPAESDLSPLTESEWTALIPAARHHILSDDDAVPETIRQSRYGRELWQILLAAALAMAIAEMAVARSVRTTRA